MSTGEGKFASQARLRRQKSASTNCSDRAYAYTAEGDPNTGIVIGDDAVMVIDTQATPVMGGSKWMSIRILGEVTDKPIKYVVFLHHHMKFTMMYARDALRPNHLVRAREAANAAVAT